MRTVQKSANLIAEILGAPIKWRTLQNAMNYIADNISSNSGAPNPDPTTLVDGEMIRFNFTTQEMEGSGDINTDALINFKSKDISCRTIITESTSVDIGPGLTLSDDGGYLKIKSNVSGEVFLPVDTKLDRANGSDHPTADLREPEVIKEERQGDDTQTMIGITNYNVNPLESVDVSKVYIKMVNPVNNFRARVISYVTGEVVKYIPSRNDFLNGTGISLAAGEQSFSVPSSLGEIEGYPIIVEVFADESIDVLGDGTNPWRAIDYNKITSERVALEKDLAMESISTAIINFDSMVKNTDTSVDIGAGTGRFVTDNGDGTVSIERVSWDAFTNVPVTGIATRNTSLVVLNNNLEVEFLDGFLTSTLIRTHLILGVLSHRTGIITLSRVSPLKTITEYSQFIDTLLILGATRGSNLNIALNTDLTIIKEAGRLMLPGLGNNYPGSEGQNIVYVNGANPATFSYFLGSTGTYILSNPSATLLDNTRYDNGTATPVIIGPPLNQATNIYVFQSPSATAGMNVMYGQFLYPTLQDAILNASKEAIVIPDIISRTSNLLAVISITAEAVDPLLETNFYISRGPKFGVEFTGGSSGGGGLGGGDVVGAASASVDEMSTYSDLTGKSIKAASGVKVLTGKMQAIAPHDLVLENSKFLPGEDITYPVTDGKKGDNITTNGEGVLSFEGHNFDLVTTSKIIDKDNDRVYVDSSAGDVVLTLADEPRNGERAQIWIGDNTNKITLFTENPTYPLVPVVNIAEANLQGAWTLQSDFVDRFSTGRDLTKQGTGGVFTPVIVNGETVDAFDFEGTSYLEAVASAYPGVTGITARSFSCHYQANNGIPTTDQNLTAWGEDVPPGGLYWEAEFRAGSADYFWVSNRNASRRWDLTTLDAIGLFDGNMHHIAITQSNANMNSVILYIDDIRVPHDVQDTYPINTTRDTTNFRVGADWLGGSILDAKLYDVRLFDKGLSQAEVTAIRNQDLTGGLVLSGLKKDTVVDVVFNGIQWVVADSIALDLLELDSRTESLESNSSQISKGESVLSIDEFGDVVLEASEQGSAKVKLYSADGRSSSVEFYEGGVRKVFAGYDALFNTYSIDGSAMNFNLLSRKWAINGLPDDLNDIAFDVKGNVGVFGLPSFTTSELAALTCRAGGLTYNSTKDIIEYYSSAANAFIGLNSTIVGNVYNDLLPLTLTGANTPITNGTLNYKKNGISSTPPFVNGVFTVDVEGDYRLSLYGFVTSSTAAPSDKILLMLSINDANWGDVENVISATGMHFFNVTNTRTMHLNVGDTVQMKCFAINNDDGNWVMSRYGWDFEKVGD